MASGLNGDISIYNVNNGSFVSSLGIDLLLGSLIGLGIQFGVGAEAIEIAAILSFSKSPWIISNPLFHESSEFNGKFIRNRIYSFNHRGIRPLTLVL